MFLRISISSILPARPGEQGDEGGEEQHGAVQHPERDGAAVGGQGVMDLRSLIDRKDPMSLTTILEGSPGSCVGAAELDRRWHPT